MLAGARRGRLAVLGTLAVAAAVAAGCRPGASAPRRDVVLITLDTTRADHLGCYGAAPTVSPRIDRVAAEGVLFTRAYATASVTPVSHASILTGQYPYRHGLRVLHGLSENRLPDRAVSLAEVLAEAGYATGAFVSAFPAGSRFGLDQGFARFDEAFLHEPVERIVGPGGTVNTGRNQRRAGETTERALEWLAGVREPFFAWIHYFDPHDPHLVPPPGFLAGAPPLRGSRAERLRQLYDLEIRYMDGELGRLLDALASTGRLEDSVVVVVSDHGQGLGDHGWWTHGILYEEQIRAPLIVRAPGARGGLRIDGLVRTVDVAPTILELAGLDPGHLAADGLSLVPLLADAASAAPRTAYADSVNMLTYKAPTGARESKDEMLFAVVDGRWKYVHHLLREEESELFDLVADPRELVNLVRSRPEEAARLAADLRARDFLPATELGRNPMSDEDLERLRSLGYLQ